LPYTFARTVDVLGAVVELRDPYTAGHQRRVAEISCELAEALGLSEERIVGLRIAALLHDVGKIIVPAEILNKPGPLSMTEMALVKAHPQAGHDILKKINFPWPVAEIVLQHHERLDGSGYPRGLKGDAIMLESRILAVADVVEAMASHRPYRPARSFDEVLTEITKNQGRLYDSQVVEAFLSLQEKFKRELANQ